MQTEYRHVCNNYNEDVYLENNDQQEFDTIIGHIEDILIDEDFHILMDNFLEKYWKLFDDSEENKLVYTDIFDKYTNTVETHISTILIQRMPQFSMDLFIQELKKRKDELDGEIFEVLFTMSDFLKFKEIMLDFKNVKEGAVENLNLNMCITRLYINKNQD